MFSDYRQTCGAKSSSHWHQWQNSHWSEEGWNCVLAFLTAACQNRLQTCTSFLSYASPLVMKVLWSMPCLPLRSPEVLKTNLNEEWETPATGGVCTGSVWCVVNSLLAVTADGSFCLLCTYSVLTKGAIRRSHLDRLALTWTCAVLAHECPRLQVCCQHHCKDCQVSAIISDLF